MEGVLLGVQFIVSFGLITAILLQTTKSEGLSGTIGGKRESVFKGKKGTEAILDKVTTVLAITFLISSLFIAILG